MLVPKLFTCLKEYSKEQFFKDCIAGIIVAIIAIPLAIALAIASGVSPEKGLYTAIIGGFIVSFMGGSRVQIGGPTGAFVVIVYMIIQKFGMQGLVIATLMAGIMLMAMGIFKMGGLIEYIHSSITNGFTCGIAIVIFSTQIKDLLGLKIERVPAEFIPKWLCYFNNIRTFHWQSLFISVFTLAIIILWPKINKNIPGTFIAIIIATVFVKISNFPVSTIGSQFGDLTFTIPKLVVPNLSLNLIKELFIPALTIAILAGVESLLSAVVADGMIQGNHRSNMELIAQGFANIVSVLFGGIPVTGAIARTAANIKNGGKTPVAGLVHSLGIFVIMFLCMPYIKLVPMSSLGAILVIVSYNMGTWEVFPRLKKAPKSDAFLFLLTFLLTILVDLVFAITIGIIISSFLFMRKMSELTCVDCKVLKEDQEIVIFEIKGPFFFAAVNKCISIIKNGKFESKALILKMDQVPFIDSTAYLTLEKIHKLCEEKNQKLIIVQLQKQPQKVLDKYGYIEKLGRDKFFENLPEALKKLKFILE